MFKALKDAWSGRTSLTKAMLFYGVGVTSLLAFTQFLPAVVYVMQFVILVWIAASLKITWSVSRLSGHGHAKAAALLLSQFVLNAAPVIAIAVLALMVRVHQDPGSPLAYANLPSQRDSAPDRLSTEYGIGFPAGYKIRHVSSWRYGEEFGEDLVIEVSSEELQRWISEVHPFGEPLQRGVQSNFPRFSVEWLCEPPPPGQRWRRRLIINDQPISDAICGLLKQRREVYSATLEVRVDWILRITVFESERLIWFHEVET